MTSKAWICERTHSLCLSPDAFLLSGLPRSGRPEARHLDPVAEEFGVHITVVHPPLEPVTEPTAPAKLPLTVVEALLTRGTVTTLDAQQSAAIAPPQTALTQSGGQGSWLSRPVAPATSSELLPRAASRDSSGSRSLKPFRSVASSIGATPSPAGAAGPRVARRPGG
jgi:hypothetical protein